MNKTFGKLEIDLEELVKFIEIARMWDFGGEPKGEFKELPDGTRRFKFGEGNWQYVNEYEGINRLSGRMKVSWQRKQNIWVMNYHGNLTEKSASLIPKLMEQIFFFLNDSRRLVTISVDKVAQDSNWRSLNPEFYGKINYYCSSGGNITRFRGTERVYITSSPNILLPKGTTTDVFTSDFHGGVII